MISLKIIYFIIPCYNEEDVLKETSNRLEIKINSLINDKIISEKSKIVFIDDGSKDNTWCIIEELSKNKSVFCGIKLSCNRGHQNAILAGLLQTKEFCDATISIDADLQDDIDILDEFIQKFYDGCDIIYGVRKSRKKDTLFKRNSAKLFYKLMSLLGSNIVYNHADYRLLSKRTIESLSQFREVNLFLRGIIPLIGYKSSFVFYERKERLAGESKYTIKKMLSFAFEGITSFSIKPLRMIMSTGILIFLASLIILVYLLVQYFLKKHVDMWIIIVFSIWAIGGFQVFCIGLVGEYIGKIYMETKNRPRFIIDKFINNK
ncbi:glycosyltransferase family 2 protein [Clostridioides sp. ES-S-0108-01]|nr:glycosyltransferase family 2 protein [Clostridioides sp. ES-S-0171-01]MCC0688966.1 glycosyltransferase family 2 protein [Clostridioides sp. ES-S-0056-01]MCC0716436.1 glycosyltransferase family 2 protein [Clostridioides sp. ES-S-0077-01]MCC0783404.1 glycosyltransferase family 2 protein [Clostridioides sp. ES-S-0108-01]UDN50557.1 glycosyltransferase family 2 protein [Clostridioides sp. ES-S-0107-01]UDN54032.1 glycosyltransferase family 2 protein [Clostridioides sp. ES-S-0054-01]